MTAFFVNRTEICGALYPQGTGPEKWAYISIKKT